MRPAIQQEYVRILNDEITRITQIIGDQQMVIIVARRDLWEEDENENPHETHRG